MPHDAVLLFEDETVLRWFPPLRCTWAFRGEQAVVPITGRNAKRVLFGVLNPRTGHRLVLRRFRQRQEDFQAYLRYLRQHYPGRPIWLLLDKAPGHDAARSRQLAARLGIVLVWLPKQCSELNAVDHLWKELKRLIAANRQFRTIDDEAEHAQRWFLGLTPREALRKAGVLSENFWLKDFL
jgi:transposase